MKSGIIIHNWKERKREKQDIYDLQKRKKYDSFDA